MFSKKPEASRRPGASVGLSGPTFSVFGADIAIRGDVVATADLHVDGRVEGDVRCTTLVQGEASEIDGNIEAESVRIAGVVRGSIAARELVILKSARVHGDVHYDSLTIEQGAKVEGQFAPRAATLALAEGSEQLLALAG
jgi:cytoskeletal protein CcmA (bactofilin family)